MNLILSAAAGYNWSQLEVFIKSLREVYSEKVVLILNNPDNELIKKLRDFGIDFLNTDIVPTESYQSRYLYYFDYLNKSPDYKKVLLTDSRDVFFQNNPFNFSYKQDLNFFLEDEYIVNSSVNVKWIKRTVGNLALQKIKNQFISCCGQVIGTHEKILDYCNTMNTNISLYKYRPSLHSLLFKRKIKGWDQGIHNYLVHSDFFKNVDFYTNKNGDVATLTLNKSLNFNSNNKLVNSKGNEYAIVHQYDHFMDSFKILVDKICN